MQGTGWLPRSRRTETPKQETGEAIQELATVGTNGGRSPEEDGTMVGLIGGAHGRYVTFALPPTLLTLPYTSWLLSSPNSIFSQQSLPLAEPRCKSGHTDTQKSQSTAIRDMKRHADQTD